MLIVQRLRSVILGIILCAVRCETLRAQNEASSGEDIKKELEELKLRYKKLKVFALCAFFRPLIQCLILLFSLNCFYHL